MIVKWVKKILCDFFTHLFLTSFPPLGPICILISLVTVLIKFTPSLRTFFCICCLQEAQVTWLNQGLFFCAGCLLLPACCPLFPINPHPPLVSSCSKPLWNDLGETVKFINYRPSADTMAIWFIFIYIASFTVKEMKEEKRKKKRGAGRAREDRKRTHTYSTHAMHEWCSSNDNIAVINFCI